MGWWPKGGEAIRGLPATRRHEASPGLGYARSFFAHGPPLRQEPFRPCRSSLSPPRALDWRSPVERLLQGEVCLERLQPPFPPGVPCVQVAGLAHLRLSFAPCRFVQGLRLPPGLNRPQGGLLLERQGNRLIINKKAHKRKVSKTNNPLRAKWPLQWALT